MWGVDSAPHFPLMGARKRDKSGKTISVFFFFPTKGVSSPG